MTDSSVWKDECVTRSKQNATRRGGVDEMWRATWPPVRSLYVPAIHHAGRLLIADANLSITPIPRRFVHIH